MVRYLINFFLAYKIFQLLISIVLCVVAYVLYPEPFNFLLKTLHEIK
jgi:hypothetical protein